MYIYIRACVRFILRLVNLGLVRESELVSLRDNKIEFDNLRNKVEFFLQNVFSNRLYKSSLSLDVVIKYSKSENGQDIFALLSNNFLRDKIFVEIGAYDGIKFSNTYLLEKKFGWTGMLVECIPRNFNEIKLSRDCKSILAAATNKNVERIKVVEQPAPNLSGLMNKIHKNSWNSLTHQVPGYSLDSILKMACPTGEIGFLSVDIEGAEYALFENAVLSEYNISAICVEHNFRPDAEKLRNLITAQGYRVIFEEFSGNDYWFIKI
jgi:FkbM family methyltransferase